jgi:alkylhydroperoxidase/carboxymuconolactone decarboxylase family protein YurZ
MSDYLPTTYTRFRASYPELASSLDALAAASDAAGSLSERDRRLVKLGIAIGGQSEGAVRSNVRKALAAGVAAEDVRQAAVLAITTAGFPTAIAALGWVNEVLAAGANTEEG